MKKVYSDADKTDMPLDSQKKVSAKTNSSTETKKAKISVISSKNSSNSKAKNSASKSSKSNLRSRLKSDSVDMMDLEKLNEENIKSRGFRGRRNQFIIIILSVLLAISIAVIVVFMTMSKVENNCFLNVHGDASAAYIVDGKELNEFRAPATIQGFRVLKLDVDLKIESGGSYNIEFEVEVYQGSLLLDGIQLTGVNTSVFALAPDGVTYRSMVPVSGNQVIQLFTGIAINSEYEKTLNDSNFKMEVNSTLTRA